MARYEHLEHVDIQKTFSSSEIPCQLGVLRASWVFYVQVMEGAIKSCKHSSECMYWGYIGVILGLLYIGV